MAAEVPGMGLLPHDWTGEEDISYTWWTCAFWVLQAGVKDNVRGCRMGENEAS